MNFDERLYESIRGCCDWPDDSPPDEVSQFRAALDYSLPFLVGPRHLGLCLSRAVAQWAMRQYGTAADHPLVAGMNRVTFHHAGQRYEFDCSVEVLR